MKKFWEYLKNAMAIIGVLIVLRYAVIGLLCGSPSTEPFHPNKMSQAPVLPQKPMGEKSSSPLQHELDNLPQYPWRNWEPPQPVFAPYPWREYQPPQ